MLIKYIIESENLSSSLYERLVNKMCMETKIFKMGINIKNDYCFLGGYVIQ